MLILFDVILIFVDIFWCSFDIFWYFCIFEEAGPYRARRGAGTSIFGAYFSKKHWFSPPTAQFRPREHHAVIRLATAISVHKFSSKKALCSLSSWRIVDVYKESSFSTVCRRATASGVSRCDPPRHGVFGNTNHQKRPYIASFRSKHY